ncbi:cytochrome c1 [Falsiroseomonas selenitidurans]|uniref:Cytochrome c1 n=1 Tax=Falsiroseomonas selenitidurans TaxID=2716335 RepID=A0ABX1E467_9PROT|nr:cytochrome c1 [Falsiroseomonas selenitidurans]NKC31979.1 cytochrome c1 [Falsiroseomonas selenitidurans]OYW10517.1 MAG: cytochrome c1 [Rhodospirillales bacterium 12-71-4]
MRDLKRGFRNLVGAMALGAAALGMATPAQAAGEAIAIPNANFSFAGFFGTYDRGSAQRGLQVYKEVCSACHAMHLLSYRNLLEIGLSEDQVRALAASFTVTDGPNDLGEMFERPARLSDRFRRPFPNELAARAANNGAYPVDLSVITKARADGANYVRALLTGYVEPPEGFVVAEGMNYNAYFPGHQIAMPAVLNPDQVEYADGTAATVDQMARDVATFLAWAAEPEAEQRKAMGVRIILFLIVLGGLTYAVKRKIWADVAH